MKILKRLLIYLFTTYSFACYAQDTTSSNHKSKFGMHIGVRGNQMNFSGLRKYNYLLNLPTNYSDGINIALFAGNREKFFGRIFASWLMPMYKPHSSETLILNNPNYPNVYNAIFKVDVSAYSMGISASLPVYKKNNSFFLRAMYLSAGLEYTNINILSRAVINVNNNTTIDYEKSSVNTTLLNSEISFDLFWLGKKKFEISKKGKVIQSVLIRIGYNYQFLRPNWSGFYLRNAGDENPNINLGGAYIGVGINGWTLKNKK